MMGFVTILAFGGFLRLWQLPAQILADDEWHALNTLLHHDWWHIFRHFGHADHSIPLTLYYNLLANTLGLSEWSMRLPLLLAGLATVALLPWLLRTHLNRVEQSCLAVLLAISPLAVYYSRMARPYALSSLLVFLALLALLAWWRNRRLSWGLSYILCTALAAWLHPVTLAFSGAGFLFIAASQAMESVRIRRWRPAWEMALLGLCTALPLMVLLGPPLATDWKSLSAKTGEHVIEPATLWQSVELLAGTGNAWIAAAWLVVGLLGISVSLRRSPAASGFWIWSAFLPATVIALTNAAWIHHALVFTRYNLPTLLIYSAFVAIGMAALTRPLGRLQPYALATVFAIMFLLGPLPRLLAVPNQFTGHMSYQFDYNMQRNVYNHHLAPARIPAFYQWLGETPSRYTIIVAPWHMEWHHNPLHFFQEVHRQAMLVGFTDGLCAQGRYGEYAELTTKKLKMRHFVHLAALRESQVVADFLVLHRNHPEGAPEVPDLDRCIQAMEARFGAPVFEDVDLLVFRLRPGNRAAF